VTKRSPELANAWIAGWRNYRGAIKRPPPPPSLKPHDRDPTQKRAYARELALALKQDLRERARRATELASEPPFAKLREELHPDTLAAPGERVR
jgi:hypothetical protein